MHPERSPDLVFASVVALITLAVAAATSSMGLNSLPIWFAPLGILMALALPGYALTVSVLPPQDWLTSLLLSLGLSLTVDVLGALILHLTPWGLQPSSWAVLLGGITLLGCLAALFRRIEQSNPKKDLDPDEGRKFPFMTFKDTLFYGTTLIILIGAIALARISSRNFGAPFTQLWAVPISTSETHTVEIGIRNQERGMEAYNLYIESSGKHIREWQNIALAPDEVWETRMDLSDFAEKPLRIRLYRMSEPDKIYRSVDIDPAAFDVSEFAPTTDTH